MSVKRTTVGKAMHGLTTYRGSCSVKSPGSGAGHLRDAKFDIVLPADVSPAP